LNGPINIGADLGAMCNAAALLAGGPQLLYVMGFGVLCTTIEIAMPYDRYASVLRWLTLALFTYFGTLAVAKVPWKEVAIGLVLPTFSSQTSFWTMVLAIFGTTISPYLFFWQASQEVEEIQAVAEREPLVERPRQGRDAINRIRVDTIVGMAFSNLVALAIMVTAVARLHANGIIDIDSAPQAAEALRPIAGPFAFAVFTLGNVGTGCASPDGPEP
jgi:Mn2+/Fe2+ NRAMP family transporter